MAASSSAALVHDKKLELYSKCSLEPSGTVFSQQDLVGLKIADNLTELVTLCQSLTNEQLFEVLELEGRPCWRLRSRDDATRLTALNRDEYLVYTRIEATGNIGIWSQHLKAKTRLHKTVMDRCLKSLESRKYIKRIKSVKTPGRIIYMKVGLSPSEDVTGGSWFSDGELDVDFVREVSDAIVGYVRKRSWYETGPSHGKSSMRDHSSGGPKSKKPKLMDREKDKDGERAQPRNPGKQVQAATNDGLEIEIIEPTRHSSKKSSTARLIPFAPGYTSYPTAQEILDVIDEHELFPGKELGLHDIQNLIDVLVYDGRLERLKNSSSALAFPSAEDVVDMEVRADVENANTDADIEYHYRWAKDSDGDDGGTVPGVGFAAAPCSRCPVFRLCAEGGPVNAANCVYFEEWLSKEC